MRANTRLNQILMLYVINIMEDEEIYKVRITHRDSGDSELFEDYRLPFAIEKAWRYFKKQIKPKK